MDEKFENLQLPVIINKEFMFPIPILEQEKYEKFNQNNNQVLLEDSFDYTEYQVVRGQYFARNTEPSILLSNTHFSVNSICLKKLPNIDYIQLLINPKEKKIVIRPCQEMKKDSFRWCTGISKRLPAKISCRVFLGKLFDLMKWNQEYKYLCVGKLITSNQEKIFIFDLSFIKIYCKNRDTGNKKRQAPIYPLSWMEQFGDIEKEHSDSLQVDVFNNYAIFGVKNKKDNSQLNTDKMNEESENKND